eukprot:3446713-Amphidinium_carterae.1
MGPSGNTKKCNSTRPIRQDILNQRQHPTTGGRNHQESLWGRKGNHKKPNGAKRHSRHDLKREERHVTRTIQTAQGATLCQQGLFTSSSAPIIGNIVGTSAE